MTDKTFDTVIDFMEWLMYYILGISSIIAAAKIHSDHENYALVAVVAAVGIYFLVYAAVTAIMNKRDRDRKYNKTENNN